MRVDDLLGPPRIDDLLGPAREPSQPRQERVAPQREPDFPTNPYAAFARTRVGRTQDLPSVVEAAPEIPRGMAAGIPGFIGDIETLGRAGLRYAGADVDPRSTFPTTERVGEAVFGPAETGAGRIGREVGAILSPLGTISTLARGAGRVGRAVVGESAPQTERLAQAAEKLGFKLEPMQVRADVPRGSPGFGERAIAENQKLANELASRATGTTTTEITPKFVGDRLAALGDEYNKIFSGSFQLDSPMFGAVKNMADFERSVSPATVSGVRSAADNIVDRFTAAGNPARLPIDGQELKALRDRMSYIARSAEQGPVRYRAGQFVDEIDAMIQRNNPQLAQRLAETNQKYAAAKTLEEMIERNAIDGAGNISLERLGDIVAKNAYGYGSGTSRHPLYDLAYLGRALKIRGRFEGAEVPADVLGALATRLGRTLNVAGRTQLARGAQRRISQGLRRPPVVGPAAAGAATAGRSLEEEE